MNETKSTISEDTLQRIRRKCHEPLSMAASDRRAHEERQEKLIHSENWPVGRWYNDEDFCRAYNTAVALNRKLEQQEAEFAACKDGMASEVRNWKAAYETACAEIRTQTEQTEQQRVRADLADRAVCEAAAELIAHHQDATNWRNLRRIVRDLDEDTEVVMRKHVSLVERVPQFAILEDAQRAQRASLEQVADLSIANEVLKEQIRLINVRLSTPVGNERVCRLCGNRWFKDSEPVHAADCPLNAQADNCEV